MSTLFPVILPQRMSNGRPVTYFYKRALEERFGRGVGRKSQPFLISVLFHSLISIGIGRSSVQRKIPKICVIRFIFISHLLFHLPAALGWLLTSSFLHPSVIFSLSFSFLLFHFH